MATLQKRLHRSRRKRQLPPLENGDHLDQKTFHARYEAMPDGVRAELIEGVVFMSSPLKPRHGRYSTRVIQWLAEYELATPGSEVLDNTSDIMGPQSEPQPDACLLIRPECGGQTWEDEEGNLNGAPELIVEIAWATESIDLNSKKRDYEKAGVREYIVLALRSNRVFWFVRRRGKFKELVPGTDGLFRSTVFPGLRLDPAALLRRDGKRLLSVLRQGIASRAHDEFVKDLAAAR